MLGTAKCNISEGTEVLTKWEKYHLDNRGDPETTCAKKNYCYNGWEMIIGQTVLYRGIYDELEFDEN